MAGLQVLVRSLVSRTEPVVLDLAGGFAPAAFVAAAQRMTGPRRYTALVPTQVVRLLDAGDEPAAALASFDAVLVGGSGISPAQRERVEAAGIRMVGSYGMSETCGGCVYDRVPLDGVRQSLGADDPARPGDPMRIWLGGPVVARGYRRDAEATAAGFRTDPHGVRWFGTDDAGVYDGGRLRLVGRLDALINTGGLKVDPAAVEDVLLRLLGVAEASVLGVEDDVWGQRVVAAVVPSVPPSVPPSVLPSVPTGLPGPVAGTPDLAEVRARVSVEVAPHAAPRQLLVLDAIPLRGTGKPDLVRLAELARSRWREEP